MWQILASALLLMVASAAQSATNQDRVDALFSHWSRSDAPGCAVSVVENGRIEYERGYGMADLEQGTAIGPDTVFTIASMSKQFTAAAVALLIQDGKLSWEDDIRKYVPEVPSYGTPITLRHLATHTSGLRDYTQLLALDGWNWVDDASEMRVLDLIGRQKRLNFATGNEYLYSNTGYLLLAMVVRRVSGESLGDFADQRIFRPLGMLHTRFSDDRTRIMKNRAAGYLEREDGSLGAWRPTSQLVGAGGLMTTVQDLALWERNFLNPSLGRDPQALVSELQRQGRLTDGSRIDYALGLIRQKYRGLDVVTHPGRVPGYTANMLRFPEQQLAIFVLCNYGSLPVVELSRAVADIYLGEGMRDTEPPVPASARSDVPPTTHHSTANGTAVSANLAEYAGSFRSEELTARHMFSVVNGVLRLRVGYLPEQAWTPVGADEFECDDVRIKFTRDSARAVDGFVLNASRLRGLRFVRSERD
jgi:CubicO group peptidase (beta-lactamase class C family)